MYTFVSPTIARAWCTITSNEAVDSDGSTLSTKVNCVSQVCSVFDLVDTNNPETITFMIRTTVTNGITHNSPLITTKV